MTGPSAARGGSLASSRRSFYDRCRTALLLALPLSLFAEFLLARTHHRPLGAATFASLALVGFSLLWPAVGLLASGDPSRAEPARDGPSRAEPARDGPSRDGPARRELQGRLTWALGVVGLVIVIARLVG